MPVEKLDTQLQMRFIDFVKSRHFSLSNLDLDDYMTLQKAYYDEYGYDDMQSIGSVFEYHRQKSIINAINDYILTHGVHNTAVKLANLDMDCGTLYIGNSYYHFFNEGFYAFKSENGVVVDECIETCSLGVWLLLTEALPIELFDEFCIVVEKRKGKLVEDDDPYDNCGFKTTVARLYKSKSSFAAKNLCE